MSFLTEQQLAEKWDPIINHADLAEIADPYRRKVTAILLENTENALREERGLHEATVTGTGGFSAGSAAAGPVAGYDPVLISMVRRSAPQMMAFDLCGVQPMTMPTGMIFALKSKYNSQSDVNEALFNEANTAFSGAGTTATTGNNAASVHIADGTTGGNPWDMGKGASDTGIGRAMDTGFLETKGESNNAFGEMSFAIDKTTVTAQGRALKAEWSLELQQDLKAVHGLDAEKELTNILSTEITAEQNREIIRTIYKISKVGSQQTTVAGTFDLDVDANGRWSAERFKGLLFQLDREANRIAQTTRRGKGNLIICSSDVASALAMAGRLDYAPALATAGLKVDDTGSTFAGVLDGKYKVYIDPYMANGNNTQYFTMGYKGTSAYDAGLFYCPYVPLQLLRATDPNTFQPKIGFKTRYGLVSHPMSGDGATMAANSNFYYRTTKVTNLA